MDNKRRGGMRRKKVCQFCADKTETIDYKDIEKLKKYVTERGREQLRFCLIQLTDIFTEYVSKLLCLIVRQFFVAERMF